MKISNKQKRFCEQYLIDMNATQAAVRAGYAKNSARVQANRLLTKDNIQGYIAELIEEQCKRTQVTSDSVITELAAIAFADFGEHVRASDKNKSLELLGKHLGMFTTKIETKMTDTRKKEDVRAMFDSMTVEQKLQWLEDNAKS